MKSSGIGGQAVLEGVMMKNKDKCAIAVRKPDHEITVELIEYKGISDRFSFFKVPIMRGIAAFVDSMIVGVRALTFSSSFYEEEEENQKKSDKTSEKMEGFLTFITFFLSIMLAVGIFILLPFFLSELISKRIEKQAILSIIEGVIRIALFVGYVLAISLMKDIKRFFQYHGAEHKTINCIEQGFDLTIENVRRQTKEHKRCGTSFMLFVILFSIIFFSFIHVDRIWLRYVLRILLIPLISGLSYEVIRLAGRGNNLIIDIISAPGMWMQRLTTKEPDNAMIEVAIQSVEAVFDWKTYQASLKTQKGLVNNSKEMDQVAKELALTEELSSLDKVLLEVPELAPEEKQSQLKEKVRPRQVENVKSTSEIAASLAPQEEEEDEVLRKLDRYLTFDQEKSNEL